MSVDQASLDTLAEAYAAPFGQYALSEGAQTRIARARRHAGRLSYNFMRSLARRHLRASGEMTDIVYRGCNLRLLPGENTDDMALVMLGAHPEHEEIDAFEAVIAGADSFVDIGANIGVYSMIAARHMAPGGRIVAFEPHPRTAIKLRGNARLNGVTGIEIAQKALGPAPGVATLRVMSAKNPGANTLRPGGRSRGQSVDVPVATLHEEMTRLGLSRIDVLKIDVEGMEDTVLSPFFATAPRPLWPRYIMLEVIARADWADDLCATLSRLGYEAEFRNTENIHYRLTQTDGRDKDDIHG